MNVFDRKMFVQKFQTGGESLKLPITVILEERAKRGLPVGTNSFKDPEVLEQIRLYESGMSVPQIFGDGAPIQEPFVPLVQSKISRGLSAEQIQNELAGMGMSIPLYQITQLGGVLEKKLKVTEQPSVTDFSPEISQISAPTVASSLKPNQIEFGGVIYNLPLDFEDKVRSGRYGQTTLYDIIRDPRAKLGSNISKVLEEYVEATEPFGLSQRVAPELSFEERRGTFATPETFLSGSLDLLRDFGDIAVAGLRGPFELGIELGAGPARREQIMSNFEGDPFRRTRETILGLGGVTVEEQGEAVDTKDAIDRELEDLQMGETVITAPRIKKEEVEIDVAKPTDPTKVTQEDIQKQEMEDALLSDQEKMVKEMEEGTDLFESFADRRELVYGKDYGPGTGKTLGQALAALPGEPVVKDEVDTGVERKARRSIDGMGLANFLSAIGMQGDARNLMELGTKGAQTFAALEAQKLETFKKSEREMDALKTKGLYDLLQKQSAAGILTPSAKDKLMERAQEVNDTVAAYKRESNNLGHINELIKLGEVLQQQNGFKLFLDRYVTKAQQFLGMQVTDPRDGKRKTINEMDFESLPAITQFDLLNKIITQKNIKALLQEEGKTISNIDRTIVEQIMGKITPGTSIPESLKALKMARQDTIDSLLGHKSKIKQWGSYLDQAGVTPVTFYEEPKVIQSILSFDPSVALKYFVNDSNKGVIPEDSITIDLFGNPIK